MAISGLVNDLQGQSVDASSRIIYSDRNSWAHELQVGNPSSGPYNYEPMHS